MKIPVHLAPALLFALGVYPQSQQAAIAFYNLENLFDTVRDTAIFDQDWTPDGRYGWNRERYRHKLFQIASVIHDLDSLSEKNLVFLGVSEVENRKVLYDLLTTSDLQKLGFRILHHDSPDRRGIDVAALYRKQRFRPLHIQWRRLLLYPDGSVRKYTRDILVVTGLLDGELFSFMVNHWPSRSGGIKRSAPLRNAAARLCAQLIDSISREDPAVRIVFMGDLNDNPEDDSLDLLTQQETQGKNTPTRILYHKKPRLYNPFHSLFERGWGTLSHGTQWQLYDQILTSPALRLNEGSWMLKGVGIYAPARLRLASGPYKGAAYRTFSRGEYLGGFSDHFPVYVRLARQP